MLDDERRAELDRYRHEVLDSLSTGERKVFEAVKGILNGDISWPEGHALHGHRPRDVYAHHIEELADTGLSHGSIVRHLNSLCRKSVLSKSTTWNLGVWGRDPVTPVNTTKRERDNAR